MNWDSVGESVLRFYLHGAALTVLYMLVKFAIADQAEKAGGLTTIRRRELTFRVLACGLMLAAFMAFSAPEGARLDMLAKACLVIFPMLGFGLSDGFREGEKQIARKGMENDAFRRDAAIGKVSDFTILCIFQPGFVEGIKDDYISQAVNKVGWPRGNFDWGKTFLDDEQLWMSLRTLVTEHASAMRFDEEMMARTAVIGAVFDEDHKREMKSIMKGRPNPSS